MNASITNQLSRRGKKGFTLIELLVVIAIIALLVSILLPSLKTAKDLAKSVVCLSQEKSMGNIILLYLDDNNGIIKSPMTGNGNYMYASITYNEDRMKDWPTGYMHNVLYQGKYIDNLAIFKCPAGCDYASQTYPTFPTCYLNRLCTYPYSGLAINAMTGTPNDNLFTLGNASERIVLHDTCDWPGMTATNYPFPHFEQVNVLYLDGHSEKGQDGLPYNYEEE